MSLDFSLIWLVIGLPLAGFLFQALLGGKIVGSIGEANGKKLLGGLAVAPIAIAFLIGLGITAKLASEGSGVVSGPSWISFLGFSLPFEWLIDPLSMTMVLIITGIGSLIHIYATGYMAEEREFARFFTYLNLFIASMLVLVLGNNLALLFIGWEGVGLCSYLLIGFWYTDIANAKAANKAFIVNRIGDWSLSIGMFLIVAFLVSTGLGAERLLSYDVILPKLQTALASNPGMATAIGLLLFVGACGKSAQFPLYLWLPDAMAGPTPVSALIHAATMVTSGVFLLNRMHVVFECSPVASSIVAVVGAFTALFAALVAFGQTDIKKVLAYSTVSQLGFMFIGCGVGAYWTGMFHVTTHAFFKALLFLGSGAVIHAMAHDQDMRNYGGLKKYLPITMITMVIGWLAIAGFPLLSGFYSKESILGAALNGTHAVVGGVNYGAICGWVGLGVAFLTAMYMTRMMMLTFFGNTERWRSIPVHHGHDGHEVDDHHALDSQHTPKEVPASMSMPLIVLAILSLGGGFVLNAKLESWLYPNGLPILKAAAEHGESVPLQLYSIIAALGGMALGIALYFKGLPADQGFDESKWKGYRKLERDQFGYDRTMESLTVDGGRDLAIGMWKGIDDHVVSGATNGAGWIARLVGNGLKVFQSGVVRWYAMVMLCGVVAFVGYFVIVLNGGVH